MEHHPNTELTRDDLSLLWLTTFIHGAWHDKVLFGLVSVHRNKYMNAPYFNSPSTYLALHFTSDQMIFEPPRRVPVPSSDILSYLFSDPPYDHDEPVRWAFYGRSLPLIEW